MPFDIVTLRPTGTTSQHLAEALARATAAQSEQSAEFQRLQQQRDDLLLDGSAAAMAKADAALVASRDLAEKIASVIAQLGNRLATAQENETIARVAKLRTEAETSEAALASWWTVQRVKLATELTSGVTLLNVANNARQDFDMAAHEAAQRYPQHAFPAPLTSEVDAHNWPQNLELRASMVARFPREFETLLTAGDPPASLEG